MGNENTRVMADRLRQTFSGARGRAPPPPAPETSIYDLKVEELRALLRDAGLYVPLYSNVDHLLGTAVSTLEVQLCDQHGAELGSLQDEHFSIVLCVQVDS